MSSQFQLRGHSLESLRWQLFESYGHAARIIRAERIQTGGLFGIGATTTFEVLVEIDANRTVNRPSNGSGGSSGRGGLSGSARSGRTPPARRAASPRRNLMDLLAEADSADEARPSGTPLALEQKPDFDAVLRMVAGGSSAGTADGAAGAGRARGARMAGTAGGGGAAGASVAAGAAGSEEDESEAVTTAEEESSAAESTLVPRPSTRPGDVIVLAGLRDQPLNTAWSMAKQLQTGAELLTAGDHRYNGLSHVFLDSVEVKKAKARAAEGGKPLLIAFSFGQRGSSKLSILGSVHSDQLWLVVDAAHKLDDTQSWVSRACRYAVPDALAVVGVTDTATPESVNALKIPVGWVDGRQATASEL